MEKRSWYVVDDSGNVLGHDMSELPAKNLASEMAKRDPEAGWEALDADDDTDYIITQRC